MCSPRSTELKFCGLAVTTPSAKSQAQFLPAGPPWRCSALKWCLIYGGWAATVSLVLPVTETQYHPNGQKSSQVLMWESLLGGTNTYLSISFHSRHSGVLGGYHVLSSHTPQKVA